MQQDFARPVRSGLGRRDASPRVKISHGEKAEPDEEREHAQLRDRKWWLGLCGRKRIQERYFLERLHHADEAVEIKRGRSASHINPTPRASQPERVKCEDRERQKHERED